MRLWHTSLIPYLPRQQLLGQWRELNSIYKLQNRHILINFVYEYPKDHLYSYSCLIIEEMVRRGYKYNLKNLHSYFLITGDESYYRLDNNEMFKDKMTPRYLEQCLYNLQEKHDCGRYYRRMETYHRQF